MNNPGNMSSRERSYQFLVSPPQLRRLASHQMALIVCQHVAHNIIDEDDDDWENFTEGIPNEPDIPCEIPKVRSMVCNRLSYPVGDSIEKWCRYHQKNVFSDSNDVHQAILNCIDEFVLTPDGTISEIATAKNMLVSDKFDECEKFRLACVLCLVDDVNSIWPLVSRNPRIISHSNSNPLIRYWISTMKGQSQRLPGDEDDSLEERLKPFGDMWWSAVGYFWNKLSDEEQITLAQKLLDSKAGESTWFIERLLQQLNRRQIKQILINIDIWKTTYSEYIVFNCTWRFKKHMLRIWNSIKYFLPVYRFQTIVEKFIEEGFVDDNHRYMAPLLFQMWTDAPVRLKSSLTSSPHQLEAIFRALHSKKQSFRGIKLYQWNYDMRFFIAVLTDLSFQTRNKLWCKFWTNMIIGTTPKCLAEIMKLCFNNEDEIVQFKERHMLNPEKIKDFSVLLIEYDHISKLEQYFKFCSSNFHFVAIVKRNILAIPDVQQAFLVNMSNEKFYEFDKFIDSAYFDDEDARNYKRKLMLPSKHLQDTYAGLDRTKLGVSWI